MREKYTSCDVFNMDETGFLYSLFPYYTLGIKGDKFHGRARSKQCVTVVLCCNADGSEVSSLGYRRMFAQNRHVLLTLDRYTAHNVHDLNLSNITFQFFPPNATSHLQPLDQGIISLIKRAYRKRLGSAFTELGDSNTEDVHELDDATSPDELTVLQDVVNPGISFEEFINVDDDVAICASVETDVPQAMNEVQEEPSEESRDEENTDTIPPTCQEMFTALDCLERFASTYDVTAGFPDAIIAICCEITKYCCSHECQ
ncbi:tigger transposable element-derived protein 6-like [Schistocerca gregaria]|uniref:tigger transposable element-derived protein 6-like n=1 Tax=Schistocerca gregaria TaxID=7010 RepID=UPI00211DCC01|nr:tigger transposable element-derived protein 6-like [Schistocerca gregaria]